MTEIQKEKIWMPLLMTNLSSILTNFLELAKQTRVISENKLVVSKKIEKKNKQDLYLKTNKKYYK